jgi:hypothetical protein
MKTLLRLLSLLLFAGFAAAQAGPDTLWTRCFDWPETPDRISAVPGGYIISGVMREQTDQRVGERVYVKINSHGDSLWSQRCSGLDPAAIPRCLECGFREERRQFFMKERWMTEHQRGEADTVHFQARLIAPCADGGWLLCGQRILYNEIGQYVQACAGFFLTKIDSVGNELWLRMYAAPGLDSLPRLPQADRPRKPPSSVPIAAKHHGNAVVKPQKKFNGQKGQRTGDGTMIRPNVLRALPDGGAIVAGSISTAKSARDEDVYVARIDEWGDTLWTWQNGTDRQDFAHDVLPLPGGGFLVLGIPATMAWLSPEGQTVWIHHNIHLTNVWSCHPAVVPGGFLVTDRNTDPAIPGATRVMHFDDNGIEEWSGVYGTSPGIAGAIAPAEGGRCLLAGTWNGKFCIICIGSEPGK